MRRREFHLIVGGGRLVKGEGLLPDGYSTDHLYAVKFVCALGQRLVDVHDRAAAQTVVDSITGAHHRSRFVCRNQFFLIFFR